MKKTLFNQKDMQAFIENLWDATYIVDSAKKITHWSRAAEEITGYKAEAVIGKTCGPNLLSHHCDSTILCSIACPLKQTIADGITREAQVSFIHKDGSSIPIFLRTVPYHDGQGNICGAIEIFRKLTGADEMAHLLQELNNLAYVEPLTKAARRNYGELVLEKALAAFITSAAKFGVLLLDIDDFKKINDDFGHATGDYVLTAVSGLIRQNLRSSDLLVRWGGDEFLIIATNTDAEAITRFGHKICCLIADSPLAYNGNQIAVTASIGGTLPVSGDTVARLLERADKNMYASKRQGKNRCCVG